MAADDRAVVVGINRYPAFPSLEGPENDATAFTDWLREPDGGDVPEGNIDVILSSKFEPSEVPHAAEPTAWRVQQAFEQLIDLAHAGNGPVGRRLYIFMAGHGAASPIDIDDAAVLMANAGRGRMGHYVPVRPLAHYFRTAAFFDEVVLFVDCCRDDLPKLPVMPLPWDAVRNPRGANVKYVYAFATKWSRKARERPLDNGATHGLFTASVLEGLRAGAYTPARLRDFVASHLPTIAKSDACQEPEFVTNDWGLELTTGDPSKLPRLRITFKNPDAALKAVISDHTFAKLHEHPLEGPPWEQPLRPGLYLVSRSDGSGETSVKLTGGTVDVDL